MESKYFKDSPEASRIIAILEGRKTVLSDTELKVYNSSSNPELLSNSDTETSWIEDPSLLEDPNYYNKANKKIIADLSGLLSGGELLTDISDTLKQSQEMEISALERHVSKMEADIYLVKSILRASKAGSELWTPSWEEDQDSSYISREENAIGDSFPEKLQYNQKSGNLNLNPISVNDLYSSKTPARIRLLSHVGGDLVSSRQDIYSEFKLFPVIIHSKSNAGVSRESIPWLSQNDSGVASRIRIDLSVPGIFSKISVCAGIQHLCKPGNLFWYPFGNEGLENVLRDQVFSITQLAGASGWTCFGQGSSVLPASGSTGPDATIRLTEYPLLGDNASLLVLNPGLSESTYQNQKYSTKVGAFQTLQSSLLENGGPLRLAVRWRGLGKFIAGDSVYVTVEFYGNSTGNNVNELSKLIYTERFNLNQGLSTNSIPAAGEFSLSRFLVHCPNHCVFAKVILTCQRPGGYSDPLSTSIVEIAQVSIDGFAGNFSTWNPPVKGQPGGYPSYTCSVPFQPEAVFFELILNQTAYEKNTDLEGYYGNNYDLSIRDILIEGLEYSRSGRWISKPQQFIGEPRRFELIVPESIDTSNIDFKIVVRPGEQSFSIDTETPLQILSTEESSLGFSDNTITYNVQDKTETFEEGTDLSGILKLSYYPYINKTKVLEISNRLTVNGQRLEYDPNAIDPLVYT